MSDIGGSDPKFTKLDDASASAYRQAVQLGRFARKEIATALDLPLHEVVRVERVLRDLRLLQPMPGSPGTLAPVSPDAAAADLLGPTDEQVRRLQRASNELRGRMLSLMPAYFEGRRQRNQVEAFDVIEDVGTVQSLLDEHRSRCVSEMLTVQPGGPRPAHVLEAVRDSTLATLARGVRMRTIYQHTARSDLTTSTYVRDVTAKGAEVRTTDEVIDRMVIYDRSAAFLPVQKPTGPDRGAVIVREPNLVTYLCAVFDHLWNSATPFEPETTTPGPVMDDVKRSILRLMGNGYKDEMVARRLGMSVRTCRRHISEITKELKAESRFQAGVQAALHGLLDPGPDE